MFVIGRGRSGVKWAHPLWNSEDEYSVSIKAILRVDRPFTIEMAADEEDS
jgi:hypothetical protein